MEQKKNYDYINDWKMKDKIEIINNMIERIINKAIENYTSQFDENNIGLSVEDWKSGYKNDIRGLDGSIIKYISPNDFKNLYSNFKYDLNKATNEQLDFIINYLKEEEKYSDYNSLDRENYDLDEIQDEIEIEKE